MLLVRRVHRRGVGVGGSSSVEVAALDRHPRPVGVRHRGIERDGPVEGRHGVIGSAERSEDLGPAEVGVGHVVGRADGAVERGERLGEPAFTREGDAAISEWPRLVQSCGARPRFS